MQIFELSVFSCSCVLQLARFYQPQYKPMESLLILGFSSAVD